MQIENIYKKHSECTIILINIYKYDSITIRICNAKGAYKMKESAARMRRTQYRAQKILEAAMVLFCEKGIEETSIDEH